MSSAPAKPRKQRTLSREKIVAATLATMATEGADNLTMRGIAQACGTTAMALYHHVPDKAALVGMAVDSLFLDIARAPRRGTGWRAQLANMWFDLRAALLNTPGAGEVFIRHPILGAGTALFTEEMFRLLAEGGLGDTALVEAADGLTMLTIGSLANELTRPPKVRDQLAKQLTDTPTPLMDRYIPAYSHRDGDGRYLKALEWMLDGAMKS